MTAGRVSAWARRGAQQRWCAALWAGAPILAAAPLAWAADPRAELAAEGSGLSGVAAALWCVVAIALPWWLVSATRAYLAAMPDRLRPWALAALGAGLAVRWAWPGRFVMYFLGFEHLDPDASALLAPKYGPGSGVLYRTVLDAFAASEAGVWSLHRLCASASLVLGAGLLARSGASPGARVAAVAVAGTMPLLAADAASESPLVPMSMLMLATAAAVDVALARGGAVAWAAAAAAAALAALTRPEALVLVLPWAAWWIGRAQADLRSHARWLSGAVVVVVAIVAWRTQQLAAALAIEAKLGNTPEVFGGVGRWIELAWLAWTRRNAWWQTALVTPLLPVVVAGAGVVSLLEGRRHATPELEPAPDGMWGAGDRGDRRAWLTWSAAAVVLLLPGGADLPWLSLPRIHAPATLWLALAAGPATALLGSFVAQAVRRRTPARQRGLGRGDPRRPLGWAVAAMVCAIVVAGGGTAGHYLAVDPPLIEWQTLAAGLARAPAGPKVLATRGHDDAPDERVHLAMPTRLAALANARVVSLRALDDPDDWRLRDVADGAARLVWLGSRCTMRRCGAPEVRHPACERVRQRWRLAPIAVATLPPPPPPPPTLDADHMRPSPGTVRDLDFPWCRAATPSEIGLYRVLGPR